MSDQRNPLDESSAAEPAQVRQHALAATCLVTGGLVTGYVGLAVSLANDSFTEAPLRTTVPFLVYVLLLTPLAAVALTTRNESVAGLAHGAWFLTGLVAGLTGLHSVMSGTDPLLGLGSLHLLGAAILVARGLWVLPDPTDEA